MKKFIITVALANALCGVAYAEGEKQHMEIKEIENVDHSKWENLSNQHKESAKNGIIMQRQSNGKDIAKHKKKKYDLLNNLPEEVRKEIESYRKAKRELFEKLSPEAKKALKDIYKKKKHYMKKKRAKDNAK